MSSARPADRLGPDVSPDGLCDRGSYAGLFARGEFPLRYDDGPEGSCLVESRPHSISIRRIEAWCPPPAALPVGISEIKIPAGSHGIVYVRVSTAHQAEDELPVDSQIAELTAAVERAGATCEVVKDAGISGTDYEGRPAPVDRVPRP